MFAAVAVYLFVFVNAHGALNSPVPRGYDEVGSLVGPCGEGFDNAGQRTTAKPTGYKINLTVGDENAKIVVNAGTGGNPKSFPYVVATVDASLQRIDIPIDFSKIPSLKNGDLVTLQVINTAEDGIKYICADLTMEMPGGIVSASSTKIVGQTHSTDVPKPATTSSLTIASGTESALATTSNAANNTASATATSFGVRLTPFLPYMLMVFC